MEIPTILNILIEVFVVLFAITVHEAAHAWTALKHGDPTAAALGRVSLNPLAHIDLVGTILLPAFLIFIRVTTGAQTPVFGWAKPVPFNPYNLRHPRKDRLWISFAGPIANVLTALVATMLYRSLRLAGAFASGPGLGLAALLEATVVINIALAFFNLIPVPPLDGSGILAGLLPAKAAAAYDQLRPYSIFLLIFLIYTKIFDRLFVPVRHLIRWLLF